MTNKNRVGFFGGVQDNEDAKSVESDDKDGTAGNFFNDILSVNMENQRATSTNIELTERISLKKLPAVPSLSSLSSLSASSLSWTPPKNPTLFVPREKCQMIKSRIVLCDLTKKKQVLTKFAVAIGKGVVKVKKFQNE